MIEQPKRKETIVLKVEDIVKNPYLACDYLFIEEKRTQLLDADIYEVRGFQNFISKNKKKIGEILSSQSYKDYVNAQNDVKDYTEQLKTLADFATTAIETATGVPVLGLLVKLAQAMNGYFHHKDMEKFVEEMESVVTNKHIGLRLEHMAEEQDKNFKKWES
ncbi:hypothetical protein CON09_15935 [Bacillus anthracis]|nr:hypothetical protein CON09_15935 [Bacillus anthracis]